MVWMGAGSRHLSQPTTSVNQGDPSMVHVHQDTPGQHSLRLQLSCQGDKGAKHPGTLQACTISAPDDSPGHCWSRVPWDTLAHACLHPSLPARVLVHGVSWDTPACTHFSCSCPASVSTVQRAPEQPQPVPTLAVAVLPVCPLCPEPRDYQGPHLCQLWPPHQGSLSTECPETPSPHQPQL